MSVASIPPNLRSDIRAIASQAVAQRPQASGALQYNKRLGRKSHHSKTAISISGCGSCVPVSIC